MNDEERFTTGIHIRVTPTMDGEIKAMMAQSFQRSKGSFFRMLVAQEKDRRQQPSQLVDSGETYTTEGK